MALQKTDNGFKSIIHCTGDDSLDFEATKKLHIEVNGWSDIGYHFFIEKDGYLRKGRPLCTQGAHCKGYNDYVGICLQGSDVFTLDQSYELFRLLIGSCFIENDFDPEECYPHWYFDKRGKTCPNINLALNKYWKPERGWNSK